MNVWLYTCVVVPYFMLKMAFLSGALLVALVYGRWVSQVIQMPGEVTYGVPSDAMERIP